MFRKRGDLHRPLIFLASQSMVAPSVTRIAYQPVIPIDGAAFTLLVTYLFVLTPFALDRFARGRIHFVFKVGVPLYVVTQH